MAVSDQVDVGTVGVKVVSARSVNAGFGRPNRVSPVRYVTVKNIGSSVAYLGGSDVTTNNGIPLSINGTFNLQLSGFDEIWACTASITTIISYIETGSELN